VVNILYKETGASCRRESETCSAILNEEMISVKKGFYYRWDLHNSFLSSPNILSVVNCRKSGWR
jgi:hypothetical protein